MKCAKEDLLLYAVTDRHWLNGRTLYEVVKESLDGGVTFLQLREKTLDEAHFLEEAKELQKLCKEYKVPFIINDNVDIAVAMNADGVHVGQSDMEAGDVRAKLGPDKIIGVSTQTVEQAILAEKHGADYLGVGAVFPTTSKDDAAEVSYDTLKAICEAVSIPVSGTAFPDRTARSHVPCQVCGLSVGASAGAFVGAVQKIRKKSSRKMRKGRCRNFRQV